MVTIAPKKIILAYKSLSFQNSTNMILTMAMKTYSNVSMKLVECKKKIEGHRIEQNDAIVPSGVEKIAGSSDEHNEFVNTSEGLVPVSEKGKDGKSFIYYTVM